MLVFQSAASGQLRGSVISGNIPPVQFEKCFCKNYNWRMKFARARSFVSAFTAAAIFFMEEIRDAHAATGGAMKDGSATISFDLISIIDGEFRRCAMLFYSVVMEE